MEKDQAKIFTAQTQVGRISKETQMNRKAVTLIELLIVIAIIAIMAAIIFPLFKTTNSGNNTQTGVYQCIKTYVVNTGGQNNTSIETFKRVDLRAQDGSIDTMECNDDFWQDVIDSDYRYSQFESGKWYSITSIGIRQRGSYPLFPNITDVQRVPDPPAERE